MKRLFNSYGMLGVLLILCLYFTWATYHQESSTGRGGGEALAGEILAQSPRPARIVIVTADNADEKELGDALANALQKGGATVQAHIIGDPPTVRQKLVELAQTGTPIDLAATTQERQGVLDALQKSNPAFAKTQILLPSARSASTFLSANNLRNVADQISVIAIIAVGMTMVIITGGIDLSVGSLIALSAVLTAWLIRANGGANASPVVLMGSSLAAIALSGGVGLFSGLMVTGFRIPPFIATLAMMQVASGMAYIIAQGHSIDAIPPSFTWLGSGEAIPGLPNTVLLMALIYVLAHILMTQTAIGRRIYAVGGNAEAARLSGVRNHRTLLFVYGITGLLAGIGGIISASQLKAGAPTYGAMYELYVIAAVVVGGTSLSGGEGQIFGTLIGAFIIAVIQNGMNLTQVEPYTQRVVLGLVILGAVLLDRLKRRHWGKAKA